MNTPPNPSQQVVFVAPCKGGKKETELYWRWVEEVKPPLPRDFRHKFHMAAILLKVRRTYVACRKYGSATRSSAQQPHFKLISCPDVPWRCSRLLSGLPNRIHHLKSAAT